MQKRKRITIKDVAKETGLAVSTVSNALAGKPYVTDETRQIVKEASERLGYRASMVARALRLQRSFIIGVLIADVANPSSAEFVRGVEDVANREKCTLLLCNTDGDEEKQLRHMQTLVDQRVDGMVLISQHCSSGPIREILDSGIPFVLVQRRSLSHQDDYVGTENVEGLGAAIRHVHELGHRRVGFVRGPMDSSSAKERLDTFLRESAELRLDTSKSLIFHSDYSFSGGLAAGEYFCNMSPRPTCVMASSDMNALGFMQYALDRALDIPRDISVVGLDNIVLSGFRTINLTTINLPKRDVGTMAAELLMKRIAQPRRKPRQLFLPTKLIVRGSTAPPSDGRVSTARRRRSPARTIDLNG